MPGQKTTPAVYIEEISKFPPSVAAVKTAIPAFVGYTQKAGKTNNLFYKPIRIASMLDYESLFGGAPPMSQINVSLDSDGLVSIIEPRTAFYLYHSLQLFFANGGGACYIVSVGNYVFNAPILPLPPAGNIDRVELENGIKTLAIEDEPTLLVCPDASLLKNVDKYTGVYSVMLQQCEKLQDRFAILDVSENSTSNNPMGFDFRNTIPTTSSLKYGAAYYPFVRSTISLPFDHAKITGVNWLGAITDAASSDILGALTTITTPSTGDLDIVEAVFIKSDVTHTTVDGVSAGTWRDAYEIEKATDAGVAITFREAILKELIDHIKSFYQDAAITGNVLQENYDPASNSSLVSYRDAIYEIDDNSNYILGNIPDATGNTSDPSLNWDSDNIDGYFNQAMTILENLYEYAKSRVKYLEDQLTLNNGFYAYIRQSVESQGLILPPSAMMAGVYARVDNLRGVWKAPANVGLNMVIAPTVKISHEDHGDLNVHSTGKSINAIRSYIGKGNMVMGARTLAGNSNEWRYVPVRRLFIFVEESVQEACEQFLFEPNDANTWVNVKGMINNFLYNLWRDGALAGAKPDEAYFIKIGLPETMNAQDILNGVMNVEIGLAAVRPAEFIILKFSHKLQTS